MTINGIVLSSIIITNILVAGPKDGVASPITDGFKLLEMMNHQSDEVNRLANMYIWGVAVGLDHNYFTVDFLTGMNPDFEKRVKGSLLLELPETIIWVEISDIVYQYLINHKGDLYYPNVVLIDRALNEVYGGVKD